MSEEHTFHASIQDAGGGGAFVTVPFDVERAFGKKRVPVRATVDGEPYRGTLVRMGGPDHILVVLKEIREKLGKSVGDEIRVTVAEDTEPREVEVPADLQAALDAAPHAAAFFGSLSYTHRKEYVRWVEEAKREATRAGRIDKTIGMLVDAKKPR